MHSTSSPGKCETEARFCCLYPELLDSHLQNLCDLMVKRSAQGNMREEGKGWRTTEQEWQSQRNCNNW